MTIINLQNKLLITCYKYNCKSLIDSTSYNLRQWKTVEIKRKLFFQLQQWQNKRTQKSGENFYGR